MADEVTRRLEEIIEIAEKGLARAYGIDFVPFNGRIEKFLTDNLEESVLAGNKLSGDYMFIRSPFAKLSGAEEKTPSFAISLKTGRWYDNSTSGSKFLEELVVFKRRTGSLSDLIGFFGKGVEPIYDETLQVFKPNKNVVELIDRELTSNHVKTGQLLDIEAVYRKYRTYFLFLVTPELLQSRKPLWAKKIDQLKTVANVGYCPNRNSLLFFHRIKNGEEFSYSRYIIAYPLQISEDRKFSKTYSIMPEELAGIDLDKLDAKEIDKIKRHPKGTFITASESTITREAIKAEKNTGKVVLTEGAPDAISCVICDNDIPYAISYKDMMGSGSVLKPESAGATFLKKIYPVEMIVFSDTGQEEQASLFATSLSSNFYRSKIVLADMKAEYFDNKEIVKQNNVDITDCLTDRDRAGRNIDLSFVVGTVIESAIVANKLDGGIPVGISSVELQRQRTSLVLRTVEDNKRNPILLEKALACLRGEKRYEFRPNHLVEIQGTFGSKVSSLRKAASEIGISCLPGTDWLQANNTLCDFCAFSKVREEMGVHEVSLERRNEGDFLASVRIALPVMSPGHTQVETLFSDERIRDKHQKNLLLNLGVLCAGEAGTISRVDNIDVYSFLIDGENLLINSFVDPAYIEYVLSEKLNPSAIENEEVSIIGYPVFFNNDNQKPYFCIHSISRKKLNAERKEELGKKLEESHTLSNLGYYKRYVDKEKSKEFLSVEDYENITNELYRFAGYYFSEVMMAAYLTVSLSGRNIVTSDGRIVYGGQHISLYGDPSSGKTYVAEMFLRLFNERNVGLGLADDLRQGVVSSDIPGSSWKPGGNAAMGKTPVSEYVIPIRNNNSFIAVDEFNPGGIKMSSTSFSEWSWSGKSTKEGIFNNDKSQTNEARCPAILMANSNAKEGAVLEAQKDKKFFFPYKHIPALSKLFIEPFICSFNDSGIAPMVNKRVLFLVTPGYYGSLSRIKYLSRLKKVAPFRGYEEEDGVSRASHKEREYILRGIVAFSSWVRSLDNLTIEIEAEKLLKNYAGELSKSGIVPDSGIKEQFADADGNERKILSHSIVSCLLRGDSVINASDVSFGRKLLLDSALHCSAGNTESLNEAKICPYGYVGSTESIEDISLNLTGSEICYTGILEDTVHYCVTPESLKQLVGVLDRTSRNSKTRWKNTYGVTVDSLTIIFDILTKFATDREKRVAEIRNLFKCLEVKSMFSSYTDEPLNSKILGDNPRVVSKDKCVIVDSTFFTNNEDTLFRAIDKKARELISDDREYNNVMKATKRIVDGVIAADAAIVNTHRRKQ